MEKPYITITRMQIGEYEVPVPHGLSELLNTAGAWGPKRENLEIIEEYDREVFMRDGRIITRLTKRK